MATTPPSHDPRDNSDDEEEEQSDETAPLDLIQRIIQQMGGLSTTSTPPTPTGPPVLPSLDLEGVAVELRANRRRHIIVMSGAGVSTSAGIPDFRSPGTGLYDNLQKYALPDPTCIFDIDFFRERPEPFFELAKEIQPRKFVPTTAHYFVRLLHDKGLLLRNYTQNIDTLERKAGVPGDALVEAHGSFATAHCISCGSSFDPEKIFEEGEIPRCQVCHGLVKPDIVFFGEDLPQRFHDLLHKDFSECDLLFVIGTSLQVQPFASLIQRVSKKCPRVLINRETVGENSPLMRLMGFEDGFEFASSRNYRDVAILGDCDEGVMKLADAVGWGDELRELVARGRTLLKANEAGVETTTPDDTVQEETVNDALPIGPHVGLRPLVKDGSEE